MTHMPGVSFLSVSWGCWGYAVASLLGGGRGGQRTGDDGPGGCCAVELGEQVGCRAGCWSPRPRPLPGCAADPPSQTPSPCSSAPMALTRRASGGGGVGAASSVRRQVGVPSGVAWPGRMGHGSGGGPGSWETSHADSCQAAVLIWCCQAVVSSYLVPVLRRPCRMPTSRFASYRRAAW